ncbi:Uncharacterized protein HZ326_17084 [Fusarium oxysporum f. sp. albedinis]|nr:Uncharacterized protein HZ326_17084 [Fusarium oxysporum f. sp. albedinis]
MTQPPPAPILGSCASRQFYPTVSLTEVVLEYLGLLGVESSMLLVNRLTLPPPRLVTQPWRIGVEQHKQEVTFTIRRC